MLATPWPKPFDDDRWVFELKWDGVRCIARVDSDGVDLRSRAGNNMTDRYPELSRAYLPIGSILDGEIVALDQRGRPSFELLQGRMHRIPGAGLEVPVPITYVVFDLLADQSGLLLDLPLEARIDRLCSLELPNPVVVGDRYASESKGIWGFVVENDLEGIVAKRLGSPYVPGTRSPDWRKVGNFKHLRAVVGGFTEGTGGRSSSFGALLLGLWDGDRLRWIGAVGSGFSNKSLMAIRSALNEMTVAESPFLPDAELPRSATWVQPQLVAMVRFKHWTKGGKVRAPSFRGFTDDPLDTITWGTEGPVADV